ncbi:hypothetical protein [Flavobacterium sp.]|jgi:hypothetical protein|uniref:hypothetical protein n=1 Tax=Flavobacterium sp. TaxID=239 RepID=UPI0037C07E1F
MEENRKYWKRIRANIKKLKKEGKITKRYKYESFCNNFIPLDDPLDNSITNKCLCDHDIKYNYKYIHKDREDYFILGSCCIKKFSTFYKNQRKCKECNVDIKKNESNLCKICRDMEREKIKEQEKRKCKCCGYIKADDKYKYCYYCNQKKKYTYNNNY